MSNDEYQQQQFWDDNKVHNSEDGCYVEIKLTAYQQAKMTKILTIQEWEEQWNKYKQKQQTK